MLFKFLLKIEIINSLLRQDVKHPGLGVGFLPMVEIPFSKMPG